MIVEQWSDAYAGADLGFIKGGGGGGGGGLTQGTNLLGRGSEAHFPACEACWNQGGLGHAPQENFEK